MRWKLKVKAKANEGEHRVITRFALFPRVLDDNYRVWLERYYVRQIYWIFRRKGEWCDKNTWSESTEKKKFLNSIKYSEADAPNHQSLSFIRDKNAGAILRKGLKK